MKVYVIMISPDEPPYQQVQMNAEAIEVWFDEEAAYDKSDQLNNARKDKIKDRTYWVDEVILRIKDE